MLLAKYNYMRYYINEKLLRGDITTNAATQRNPLIRVVPLFLKDLVVRTFYTRVQDRNSSAFFVGKGCWACTIFSNSLGFSTGVLQSGHSFAEASSSTPQFTQYDISKIFIGVCAILWVILIPVIIYTKQPVYVSLLFDGLVVVAYLVCPFHPLLPSPAPEKY